MDESASVAEPDPPETPERSPEPAEVDDPRTITRPDPALLRYYLIVSLFALVFFPFVFLPLYLRYRTLRYRFDEEGVSMSVGMFSQQETYVNYRRIQDIEMTRGVVQRRLGLADLKLQTASGSSGAEMKIEGIRNPERLRDFLYERMRGGSEAWREGSGGGTAHAGAAETGGVETGRVETSGVETGGVEVGEAEMSAGARPGAGNRPGAGAPTGVRPGAEADEALRLLQEIREELRALNALPSPQAPEGADRGSR